VGRVYARNPWPVLTLVTLNHFCDTPPARGRPPPPASAPRRTHARHPRCLPHPAERLRNTPSSHTILIISERRTTRPRECAGRRRHRRDQRIDGILQATSASMPAPARGSGQDVRQDSGRATGMEAETGATCRSCGATSRVSSQRGRTTPRSATRNMSIRDGRSA
jgi:hypothetical protein